MNDQSAGRRLEREITATAALKDQLKAILGGDDTDATILADSVESETNLLETIDAVLGQIGMDTANIDGLKRFSDGLDARKGRLERRVESMRTMLASALEIIEQKKLERPAATLTLKDIPPKVVITNEADIPATYWKSSDPKLDRVALKDAIKAGIAVSGAELGNGGTTVQIRFS